MVIKPVLQPAIQVEVIKPVLQPAVQVEVIKTLLQPAVQVEVIKPVQPVEVIKMVLILSKNAFLQFFHLMNTTSGSFFGIKHFDNDNYILHRTSKFSWIATTG